MASLVSEIPDVRDSTLTSIPTAAVDAVRQRITGDTHPVAVAAFQSSV